MTPPSTWPTIPNNLTGSITTGGRGVVANTTYAFCAACIGAILLAALFALTGHEILALVAVAIIFAAFFLFFFVTWHKAPKHPDISVSGEASYVAALAQRFMAAKNKEIVGRGNAVIEGAVSSTTSAGGSNSNA